MRPAQGSAPRDSAEVYLAHRALIERAVAAVCRRGRLSPDECEDFASTARLHLIANDCAPLRAFKGKSSFETFVVAVLSHLLQDWRNARWGKFRPSAEARRLGPVAVRLETLVVRDGYTFEEASHVLRTNLGVPASPAELEALWARLPKRTPRSFVSDDALEQIASTGAAPDSGLVLAEAVATASRARDALRQAMEAMPAQDRLILSMHFEDGLRVREVARLLHLDDKQLYRRLTRVLAELRRSLESMGLSRREVIAAMEEHGFDAHHPGPDEPESSGGVRPFNRGVRSSSEGGTWP